MRLRETAGDLTLDAVSAGAELELQSVLGAILHGADDGLADASGTRILLLAATAIGAVLRPVETDLKVAPSDPADAAGTGTLTAVATGDICLAETSGVLSVRHVRSLNGDVALAAAGDIVDAVDLAAPADWRSVNATPSTDRPAPNVFGRHIALTAGTAGSGSVGSLVNPMDIESAATAGGGLSGGAANGFFVREVTSDLLADAIAAQRVWLSTARGSILEAGADAAADIQAVSIDLVPIAGAIGTAANPIELFGAGNGDQAANGLEVDPARLPGVAGRLYAVSEQGLYLTEVGGALNVLSATAGGDLALVVGDSVRSGEVIAVTGPGSTLSGSLVTDPGIRAGGTLALSAGDGLVAAAGSAIRAGGALTISADRAAADPDPDSGATIAIGGDLAAASVLVETGEDIDFFELTALLSGGGPVTLRGNGGDDRFFVPVVGGAFSLQGGAGADRFYIAGNAQKSLFESGGFYDDTIDPLTRLGGDLAAIRGTVSIDTGTGGAGGTQDAIWLVDGANSTAGIVIAADSLTGMTPSGAVRYTGNGGLTLNVGLGGGDDSARVVSVGAAERVYVYGGSGDDRLAVGNANDRLDDIAGIVAFYGDTGTDTLTVYGDASVTAGQLTAIAATGMGLGRNTQVATHNDRFGAGYDLGQPDYPAAIYYGQRVGSGSADTTSSVERVEVRLGSGADCFTVDSTRAGTAAAVYGGAGDDTLTVSATATGLNPGSLGRVDFIAGALALYGEAGPDTIVIDDSGDDNANVGSYLGDTVTGLDMAVTGSIRFGADDAVRILLGAQDDRFYVPATTAGVAVLLDTGGGFDTVWCGTSAGSEATGSLDGMLGNLTISGAGPEARDTLYLNDQADTAAQTYRIDNAVTGTRTLVAGGDWPIDTTTVERTGWGSGAIHYLRMETVVLNAGAGADQVDLLATHREQDVAGGKSSSLTLNLGAGDDRVQVGAPVAGGFSLAGFAIDTAPSAGSVKGIPVLINGQAGADSIAFLDNADNRATDVGLLSRSFAEVFPDLAATTGVDEYANAVALYTTLFGTDPTTATYATLALTRAGLAAPLNVTARDSEELAVTLGAGNDVVQLAAGTYALGLRVNAGGGADTFNLAAGVDTAGQALVFNGESGDDTLSVTLAQAATPPRLDLTFNGGTQDGTSGGDRVRVAGDGLLAGGEYRPSATEARAGTIAFGTDRQLRFTGVEPLIVHGLPDFAVVTPDNAAELVIDSIEVTDLSISNLALHTVTVEGVVTWTQQAKLSIADSAAIAQVGRAMAIDATLDDGFENGLVPSGFSMSGNAGWTVAGGAAASGTTASGFKALRAGAIGHSATSTVSRTLTLEAGTLSFDYKVSSESGYDFLDFSLDGTRLVHASGEAGWTTFSRAVTAGSHTLTWTYSKDSGTVGGSDTAWIDNLSLPTTPTLAVVADRVGTDNPGLVLVYGWSNGAWVEQARLSPSDRFQGGGGDFGYALDLCDDTIVVGAPGDDERGTDAGAVYVYERVNGVWTQRTKLVGSDTDEADRFGSAVSVDGETLVTGSAESYKCRLYFFDRGSAGWAQSSMAYSSFFDSVGGRDGAIALSGDRVAVQATIDSNYQSVKVLYRGSSGGWYQDAQIWGADSGTTADWDFGAALAFNGKRLVIGAPGWDNGSDTDQGRVLVYDLGSTGWKQVAVLTAEAGLPEADARTEGFAGDRFGASVALDGRFVVVGAPGVDGTALDVGAAYAFYELPDSGSGLGSTWTRATGATGSGRLMAAAPAGADAGQGAPLADRFGAAVALAGNQIVVGLPGHNVLSASGAIERGDAGAFRTFATDGMVPTATSLNLSAEILAKPSNADLNGPMLYHAASGFLLVGQESANAVVGYKNTGLGFEYYGTLALPGDCSRGGFSMDLDGNTLVVGAPGGNGAAVVYTWDGANWVRQQTLYASSYGLSNTGFGESVAIDGDTLVVGAPRAQVKYASDSQSDSAYRLDLGTAGVTVVFARSGSTWGLDRVLMPSTDTGTGALPATTSSLYTPSGWNQFTATVNGSNETRGLGSAIYFDATVSGITLAPRTTILLVQKNDASNLGWWSYTNSSNTETMTVSGSFTGIDYVFYGSDRSAENGGAVGASLALRDANGTAWDFERVYSYKGHGDPLKDQLANRASITEFAMQVGAREMAIWLDGSDKWTSAEDLMWAERWSESGNQWVTISTDLLDQTDTGDAYSGVAFYVMGLAPNQAHSYQTYTGLNGAKWGSSVDIVDNKVYVTAPGYASYAVYDLNDSNYTPWGVAVGTSTTLRDPLLPEAVNAADGLGTTLGGNAVGVSTAGFLLGTPGYDGSAGTDQGLLRYYTDNGSGVWSQSASTSNGVAGARYGAQDGVTAAGSRVLVGAPGTYAGAGRARVLVSGSLNNSSPELRPVRYDSATNAMVYDTNTALGFGIGGALVSEGQTVVGSQAGDNLYVFRQRGPGWTGGATVEVAALPTAKVGSAVAIDGDTAVIGAPDYDGVGAAFVFVNAPGTETWTLEASLSEAGLAQGSHFGSAVDVSGDRIVVGAPDAQIGGDRDGRAYFYERLGTHWRLIDTGSTHEPEKIVR